MLADCCQMVGRAEHKGGVFSALTTTKGKVVEVADGTDAIHTDIGSAVRRGVTAHAHITGLAIEAAAMMLTIEPVSCAGGSRIEDFFVFHIRARGVVAKPVFAKCDIIGVIDAA